MDDNNNNLTSLQDDDKQILYITLIIVVVLIFVWIIVVIFTGENPIAVLSEMTNSANSLPAVSDDILSKISDIKGEI